MVILKCRHCFKVMGCFHNGILRLCHQCNGICPIEFEVEYEAYCEECI